VREEESALLTQAVQGVAHRTQSNTVISRSHSEENDMLAKCASELADIETLVIDMERLSSIIRQLGPQSEEDPTLSAAGPQATGYDFASRIFDPIREFEPINEEAVAARAATLEPPAVEMAGTGHLNGSSRTSRSPSNSSADLYNDDASGGELNHPVPKVHVDSPISSIGSNDGGEKS
jgi:hypothetical protein